MTFLQKADRERARRQLGQTAFTVRANPNWSLETSYQAPYRHPAWRKVRARVLARDGGVCQVRGPRCTTVATDCDHIVPWRMGGPWLDPTNLRATCQSCNGDRVDHSAMSRWLRAKTEVILVVGPPLPGLLHDYLQANSRQDDFIIDYDTIAIHRGHARAELRQGFYDEAVQDERNRLLAQARRGEVEAKRIWITSSNPNAEAMPEVFPRHRVVVVDPGEAKCHEIASSGGMAQRFSQLIDTWYRTRQGTTTRERSEVSSW